MINRRNLGGYPPRAHTAVVLALIVLAAGCGQPSAALSSAAGHRGDRLAVDMAGLHIQVLDAFACPSPVTLAGVGEPADRLVLAGGRLDYDAAAVQAMAAYLTQSTYGILTGPTTPDTLAWVPVARLSEQCGVGLELTNTGQSTVQVTAAGVLLTAGPKTAAPMYRLVDACTIAPNPEECPPARGGTPTSCDIYQVELALAGSAGRVIAAPPAPQAADASCGAMTLPPAGVKDLYLILTSVRPLAYAVAPWLELATVSGHQTVALPRLTAALAFAADDQFTCYALDGTTFGLERQGTAVFQDVFATAGMAAAWCM